MLTSNERTRYARQLILPDFGEKAQEKLLHSSVLVVGAGGLASPALLYLGAAGVGTIGIMDDDTVSMTNLHRQIIHSEQNIGRLKVDSAAERIRSINPDITVKTYPFRLTAENAESVLKDYDVILDASDNSDCKYLINDTCIRLGIPFVHAGVVAYEGQVFTFIPSETPCLRCLMPDNPGTITGNCVTRGVSGPVVGVLGAIQAQEVLKLLSGTGSCLTGRVLFFNGSSMTFDEIPFSRNPRCMCSASSQKEIV